METIVTIVTLAAEGLGVRAISRTLGVSAKTVNRTIVKACGHFEGFLDEYLKGARLAEVRLDEPRTFVKKKRASDDLVTLGDGHGETRVWTSIETASRLTLPRRIGRRGPSDAGGMFKRPGPLDAG